MSKVNASEMNPAEIFALLQRIMASEFDLDPASIHPESDFESLDLDSIDAVDLAVSVEEEIGFQFETEDLARLVTVQDVVDLISGKLPPASGSAG